MRTTTVLLTLLLPVVLLARTNLPPSLAAKSKQLPAKVPGYGGDGAERENFRMAEWEKKNGKAMGVLSRELQRGANAQNDDGQEMSKLPKLPKLPKLKVSTKRERGAKPIITIDGEPTPLFWAFGLSSPDDLDAYKEAGFNTVWLDVPWRARPNWELYDELLNAIEEKELFIIIGIDMIPPPDLRRRMSVSPYDNGYAGWLRRWTQEVMKHFHERESVVGWGTSHHPEESIIYDDVGFVAFLNSFYRSTDLLSQMWGIPVADFGAITLQAAQAADDRTSPIHYARPSLDAALYRWFTLNGLLDLWARAIKDVDATRPVFTGRLTTYRAIASVPRSYDVVVTGVVPGAAEPDTLTHNVHAVDMARQANEFVAIPTLLSHAVGQVKPSLGQFSLWLKESALHGASGAAFSDWQSLRKNTSSRGFLKQVIDELWDSGIYTCTPQPTTALLYIPFGEGLVIDNTPLYGFATQEIYPNVLPMRLSLGEPNLLFFSLRQGTRFGQVDYLTLHSLQAAELSRYSCILAPLAVYLPEQSQAALEHYVTYGGVVVADFGVGAAHANEPFRLLPSTISRVLGVVGMERVIAAENLLVNINVVATDPLFPSIPEGSVIGTQLGAFGRILGIALRTTGQVWGLLMRERRRERRVQRESAAVSINSLGTGFGVFASTLLWAGFTPDVPGFNEFHSDLFRRRAIFEVTSNRGLITENLRAALFAEGAALFNPSGRTEPVSLRLLSLKPQLFQNAINQIGTQPAGGYLAALFCEVKPLELLPLWQTPVRVEGSSEQELVTARFIAYQEDKIELLIYGAHAKVEATREGFVVTAGKRQTVKLTVTDGLYSVEPNSKHKVTIRDLSAQEELQERVLTADQNARLTLRSDFEQHQVVIEPAK